MMSRCLVSLCFLLFFAWSSAQRTDPLSIVIALITSRDSRTVYELTNNITYEAKLSKIERKNGSYSVSNLNLSEPCKSHYDFYNRSLQSMQKWALTMSDSSTKFPPSSVLQEALTHLGNFDECVDLRDIKWNETSSFHGQHCLATHTFSLWGLWSSPSLKTALCVPSTCTPNDTATIAMDKFTEFEWYFTVPGVGVEVEVEEQNCHTADRPEFSTEDIIAASILAFFAIVVVFSTCYDIFTDKNESRSNLLIAFSVYTNGKKLLNTSSSSSDFLNCVHGIRFLSLAWIILCQRYLTGTTSPSINRRQFVREFIPSWKGAFITSGEYAFDTLFLLSGLMVAYEFFMTIDETNSFNIPMFYIRRYVRLTPALAIIMMLRSTLLTHSGSGPLWDATANGEKNNCVNYWWTNLVYLQNYVNPMEQCISQGWYLAVDMQLYWLSPLLLVPLWKRLKYGKKFVGNIIMLGTIVVSVLMANLDYPTPFYEMMSSPGSEYYQRFIYYPVYTRFTPYCSGIILCYFLVVEGYATKNDVRMSKILNLVMWIITVGFLIGVIAVNNKFQQTDFIPNRWELYFSTSFIKYMWPFSVGTVIYMCATGNGCFVNTILTWDWFRILSRLTYSAYLVHVSVQISQIGSLRTQIFLDDMTLFPQFLGDLIITLVFSVMLYLVFEAPFEALLGLGGLLDGDAVSQARRFVSGKEVFGESWQPCPILGTVPTFALMQENGNPRKTILRTADGGRKPATWPENSPAASNEQITEVSVHQDTPEVTAGICNEENTEVNHSQEDVPQITTRI